MLKKELETRTKRFALSIVLLVSKLARGKASDVIGYQLLKVAPLSPITGKSIERNLMRTSFTKSPSGLRNPNFMFTIIPVETVGDESEIRDPKSPIPSPCF
ncbi:MAG: hypothetical protein JO232_04390 [Verrucomicrobia bacterium]|nr:hypothetical protein [Verrucomicrobiota bacterium]